MDKDFHNELEKKYSRYHNKREIKNLCFRALINSYGRVKKVQGIGSFNENKIRDEFVIDLETNNTLINHAIENDIIEIIPERWDLLKRKRTDIVFSIHNICKLIFECKKLSSAEKRYLDDGLIRCIELDYADKESEAGMIGFIFNLMVPQKLKEKVRSFHLIRFVDKRVSDFSSSFQSVHKRINSTEILISHLFFLFKK